MEFQVEKNLVTVVCELLDEGRTGGQKQLQAYFGPSQRSPLRRRFA
jgi:hypothetical protein